jgi:hypothetical protein
MGLHDNVVDAVLMVKEVYRLVGVRSADNKGRVVPYL